MTDIDKIYFVVELLRYNDREAHSYVIGIYDNELAALHDAWEHMNFRAGKYGAEVTGYKINGGDRVYVRTLDCWDAFAASCQEMAKEIKKMIDDVGLVEVDKKNESN